MKLSERERRLVGILALLGAGWGLWQLWRFAHPKLPAAGTATSAAASTARGRASRSKSDVIPDQVVEVRTDRLDPEGRSFTIGRDPFSFGPVVPPPPPPPTPEELERRRRAEDERRTREEEAARAALEPHPPDVTVRFLGSFGPRNRRIAVFGDAAGANVYNAREGETLEGKFIVQRIGYESVDLAFVGFPDVPARRLGVTP